MLIFLQKTLRSCWNRSVKGMLNVDHWFSCLSKKDVLLNVGYFTLPLT